MMRRTNYVVVNNVIRTFSTSPIAAASHYDVLGISPKATQRDIKDAYYKLSKIHHPDKSNDEESAKKFRNITEAYEILGNVKLKKMYDKGLYTERSGGRMDWKAEAEPTDPSLKFYKSRMNQHAATIRDGRSTPIYNFDAWSQHHYSNLFEKKKREEAFKKEKAEKISVRSKSVNQEILMYSMVVLSTLFLFIVTLGKSDYDVDRTSHDKK